MVFTGEQFPDGGKADAVYLILNEPYREVLNNAPFRPLDYDYLRKLPPGAQRFYEILGRKMFAALKFKHATAKLVYSEYCTYSAQLRYYERAPMQNQMNAIHREHKKYGYIASVEYEPTVDAENKPDWIMYYEPGPKAKAEYNTFTRSGRAVELSLDAAPEDVAITDPKPARPRRTGPRQKRLHFPPPQATSLSPEGASEEHPVVAGMLHRGIAKRQALELLASAKDPDFLLDQLEWGDEQLRRARPGEIRNPAGFFVHLIRKQTPPAPGFVTSRVKRLREEAHNAQQTEAYERALLEQEYAKYTQEAVATFVASYNLHAEVAELAKEHAKGVRSQWKNAPATTVDALAERKALEVMKDRIGPNLLTFAAFCEQESERILRPQIS